MKKTIQINLGGRHFHMDEDAFHKLNHYLDSLKAHFSAEGETGKEIMEDIEQRIAELLEVKITGGDQAVSIVNVNDAIAVLGKIEDFTYAGTSGVSHEPSYGRRESRRLFRDEESNYIGGVASGLGAYFDIDPLWIRLAFIALVFLHGTGILIYAILWIVVPKARTTAEKLQMRGLPVTLSTIRESVNAEYNRVRSGLNNLGQSQAADRTRNVFESLIRAIGLIIVAIFKVIIVVLGIFFLLLGTIFLTAMILILLGFTSFFGHFHVWNGLDLPQISGFFASSGHYYLIIGSLVILVLIPIIVLIYWGIKMIFNIRTKHSILRAVLLTIWIIAFVTFISLIILNSTNYAVEATNKKSVPVEVGTYPRIHIDVRDNIENERITQYSIFDHRFNYNEEDKSLYTKPVVRIVKADDSAMSLSVEKHASNVGMTRSQEVLERISYDWEQRDSMIYIDRYLSTRGEDFWMFARVKLDVRIPENQVVVLSDEVCDLLEDYQRYRYCSDSMVAGKPSIMTADGLMLLEKRKTKTGKNK